MFEVKKCECGREVWSHSLTGKVKYENGKLSIHDGGHLIPFLEFVKSLGVHENDKITINVEKENW
jgi:hypothetical protein